MAQHNANCIEINPDPLSIKFEPLSGIDDPLELENRMQDPLLLEDLNSDSQCQTGNAEESEDAGFVSEMDPLSTEFDHPLKVEDPLHQEVSAQDSLQHQLGLDNECQTGNAEKPLVYIVDIVHVQPAEPECTSNPGKGIGPVSNVLQGRNKLKFSSVANTQNSVTSTSTITNSSINKCDKNILGNSNINDVNKHMFACTTCNKLFVDISSLKSHEKIAHGGLKPSASKPRPLNFKCEECERSFTSINYLHRHKVTRHQTGDTTGGQKVLDSSKSQKKSKNFICDECDKEYVDKTCFLRHKINDHQSSAAREILAILEKKFTYPRDLDPIKPRYVCCDRCDKSFNIDCQLRFHQLAVHDDVMCATCGMTFVTGKGRTTHMNRAHSKTQKEETFKCKICPKTLRTEASFISKVRDITMSRIKSFSCIVCDETFPSRFAISNHLVAHPGQPRVTCSICGAPFIDIIELKLHKCWHLYKLQHTSLRKHPPRNRYDCEECLKIFNSKSALTEHEKVHSDEKIAKKNVQCYYCPEVLLNLSLYRNHVLDNHKDQPMQCYICAKPFTTKKRLRLHVREHFELECDQSYKCPICSKTFKSKLSRLHHINQHRRTQRKLEECSVQCHLCFKTLLSKAALELHIARHSCKACGLTFPTILARQVHLRTHGRIDAKQFTCDICGKTLRHKASLRVHLARHVADLRIKCTLCMKTFNEKVCLKYHMRLHAKELEHKCEMCGKLYPKEVQLSFHKLKQHNIEPTVPISGMENVEETHKCSFCPKKCTRFGSSTNHLQEKQDFDPSNVYVCDMCGTTFENKNDLKMHWFKHFNNLREVGIVQMENVVQPEAGYFVSQTQSLEMLPNTPPMIIEEDSYCLQHIVPKSALSNMCADSQNDPHGKEVLDATALCDEKSSQNTPGCVQEMQTSTKCFVCSASISNEMEIEPHYESHWKLKLSRKEADMFKKRLKTHGIGSYSCHDCNAKFFVRDKFKQHLKAQFSDSFGKTLCIPEVMHKKKTGAVKKLYQANR